MTTSADPSPTSAEQQAARCRICDATAPLFDSARIMDRHLIRYFRCSRCGFIQTEEPFWIAEAYQSVFTSTDIGMVSRCDLGSKAIHACVATFFNADGKFVDWGGGYGLLVRRMRDIGFNFYRYDKYSENLFAKGFEADITGSVRYEMATVFEVFEHMPDPRAELESMLKVTDNVLLTTALVPEPAPGPRDWYYYGLNHGQHISFFTPSSLRILGERFGLKLYTNGENFHLLTPKRISERRFRRVIRPGIPNLIARHFARRSGLLDRDVRALLQDVNSGVLKETAR